MGSFLVDILEFVILALFMKALARNIGSLFRHTPSVHVRTSRGGPAANPSSGQHRGEMARDPVCGMFVSTELPHLLRRDGETMHFCSRECLEKFQKHADDVAS